ncbi:MAG: hypothetical protein J6L69_00780 [Lachnospiraceae bacterium]|nr:hypothetical protein [Lachnospiraceae bacterium]
MSRYKIPRFTDNRTRTKKMLKTWFLDDIENVNGGKVNESNRNSSSNRRTW